MKPTDDEDIERIRRHVEERIGYGFTTIERGEDIWQVTELCGSNSAVLLDSSTALLSNEMFLENGEYVKDAYIKVKDDISNLSKNVDSIIVVSDYIYSDACQYDDITENYRFGLAYIERMLAKEFDVVIEMCFSTPNFIKGDIII